MVCSLLQPNETQIHQQQQHSGKSDLILDQKISVLEDTAMEVSSQFGGAGDAAPNPD